VVDRQAPNASVLPCRRRVKRAPALSIEPFGATPISAPEPTGADTLAASSIWLGPNGFPTPHGREPVPVQGRSRKRRTRLPSNRPPRLRHRERIFCPPTASNAAAKSGFGTSLRQFHRNVTPFNRVCEGSLRTSPYGDDPVAYEKSTLIGGGRSVNANWSTPFSLL
jgi:hypothetical protein